jgi:hypothetical protein
MINSILAKLGLGDGSLNQEIDTRRKHMRHEGFQAEVQVQDQVYGLKDWSMGGICFETQPDPRMVVGDKVQFTIKFRLPHETVIIKQVGRVVRAARRGIAAEFMPLSPEARRKFARVVDGLNAASFLESQVA